MGARLRAADVAGADGRGSGRVLLASPGPLASATLQSLLEAGVPLAAVLGAGAAPAGAPGSADSGADGLPALPLIQGGELHGLAAAANIPVHWSGATHNTALRSALRRLRARHVLVACLPTILDAATLACAAEGFWNVHPSRLPAHRGPAPMFWQLRGPLEQGGVSVHRIDSGIDTGPLGATAPLDLGGGVSEPEAEYRAGRLAGELLARLLAAPAGSPWPAQPADGASYQGQPRAEDFCIGSDWPLQRAWRFVRGVRWRGQPFTLLHGGRRWPFIDAVQALPGDPRAAPGQLRRCGRSWLVGLPGGCLQVRGLDPAG